MIEDARQTVQLNLGFLVAPALELDEARLDALRSRLGEEQIHLDHAERGEGSVLLARRQPSTLQLQVVTGNLAGPGGEPLAVSQLLLLTAIGPDAPVATSGDFADAAHEITDVARDVWPEMEQVLGWNAGVRVLFPSSTEHSFQYLWERRLGQPLDALAAFGRPILGGGLRLVFPPGEEPSEQFQAEVRMETFLEDVRHLYVEVDLASGAPSPISAMNPTALVQTLEEFLQNRVVAFLRTA
ncbi:MAG TPA: hypothetical protein VHG28_19950 [Longimicrobiaceae bacterium]|nr:hypothetical protein [Longimicrobiaceae bacterium]